MFKKLFCRHDYKIKAKRETEYCKDYLMFSDFGEWEEFLYECKKCGKQKIKFINKRANCEWIEILGGSDE